MVKMYFKKLLSLLLIISILASFNIYYAFASTTTTKVVLQKKITIDLKKISTYDKSGKATAATLKIAQKYYNLCLPKVEAKLKFEFNKLTSGKANFDGKQTDEKTATKLSNIATSTSIDPNSRNFSVAMACTAFSKAAKKNIPAHNLAAVINLIELPAKSGINFKADAIDIYEYAVSLNPKNSDTLVNLGSVYMDLDRQEDAKIMFEAALKLVPEYNRAHEGMAAYWLARGDKVKAAKELQEDKIMMARSVKVERENNKILADPKKLPLITPNDSLETSKAAIQKMSTLKAFSTADMINDIDPIDAQQIRLRINHLPEGDKLRAPSVKGLSSISTHKIFCASGMEYWNSFSTYWEDNHNKRKSNNADNQNNMDMSDADMDALDAILKQNENAMNNNDFEQLMEDLSKSGLKQSKGVNSGGYIGQGGYIQQYNVTVFGRKFAAYNNYLVKIQEKFEKIVTIDLENFDTRMEKMGKEYSDKVKIIEKSGLPPAAIEAALKKLYLEYVKKRNNEREYFFQRNYGTTIAQYIQNVKPTIEQMWTDCIPHIKLISDLKQRNDMYNTVLDLGMDSSEKFIQLIFKSANGDSNYEEVTQQEIDEADEALKEVLRNDAAAEIAEANTPEKLSEESLLDKLSFKQGLGPFELKITATGIEVTGSMLIEGKLGYDWKSDTITGGLGVGVKLSADIKGAKGEIGVGTMVTITIDGKTGNVSEIDWKANADASIVIGKMTIGGGYEASVMHGNKFTPAVNAAYNQLNIDY